MADLEQYLADLTPKRTSFASEVEISANEREVVNFAEKLFSEGRAWQETLGLEALFNKALDALATKHFVEKRERVDRAQIAANYFRSIVERKLSQLTSTTPLFEVASRSGNDWAADISEDVLQAWWEEYSGQSFVDRVVLQSMTGGSAPAFATWDKSLDGWSGDIRMQCLPTRQVVVDPYLSEARLLQSDALFVGVEIVRSLSEMRLYYGDQGRKVKPQAGFSHFSGTSEYQSGIGRPYRRASNRGSEMSSSAIPRAAERRIYFRDLTLHPESPENADGTPHLLFPRKRCIVWSWDKVLLYDGDGINWDAKYPLEIHDWGMNLEHSYGESEYESLWPMQDAIDRLLSGLVHNARLQNEPPWMAVENSIDPVELDHWQRYSDHSGQFHFVKPGETFPIARPPAAYTNVVVETLQMLQAGMELISGIVPVMRGQTEPGVSAGRAIDSLQSAAAVTIGRASKRLEDFLSRYGQLVLSRIMQYFSDDRIFYLTKHPRFQEVMQQRQQFLSSLVAAPTEQEMERLLLFANRDLKLKVKPKSGLGVSIAQEVMFMERQAAAGRVEPVEVLKAARISDPEEKIEAAQEFQIKQAMRMGQVRAVLGGGMAGQSPPGQGVPPGQGRGAQQPLPERLPPGTRQ